jgi:ESS family glutamate:Na+ symporter
VLAFITLALLLGAGHILRMRVRLFQTLYLPSCVIGGLLGLLLLQSVFALNGHVGWLGPARSFFSRCSEVWGRFPAFLINVVFACLFLGVEIPKLRTLWHRAGPQVAYGQVVAWGQYAVSLTLFILLISWAFPEIPSMFAGTLPIGFEGGHGTAAGMGPVFEKLGWPAGKDYSLTSATCGIISAIVVGMVLVNWAIRRGHVPAPAKPADRTTEDDSIGVIPVDSRPSAGRLSVHSDVIEGFSLHIVMVAIAILIGYMIKQGLVGIERNVAYLRDKSIMSGFPLFPLCMIGGIIVQLWEQKFDRHKLIDPGLMKRIQNSSLDFLVIAAIATINVQVVVAGIAPLLILVAAGVGWNLFCILVLAPRMLPNAWFQRGIAELGQSMGVTATGLLLLRVVDPDYDSPAADAFACKQLVHEPFMGGGLWTATAIPLIFNYGPAPVLLVSVAAITVWLVIIFVPKIFVGPRR